MRLGINLDSADLWWLPGALEVGNNMFFLSSTRKSYSQFWFSWSGGSVDSANKSLTFTVFQHFTILESLPFIFKN
jgi:hypothetical protein